MYSGYHGPYLSHSKPHLYEPISIWLSAFLSTTPKPYPWKLLLRNPLTYGQQTKLAFVYNHLPTPVHIFNNPCNNNTCTYQWYIYIVCSLSLLLCSISPISSWVTSLLLGQPWDSSFMMCVEHVLRFLAGYYLGQNICKTSRRAYMYRPMGLIIYSWLEELGGGNS